MTELHDILDARTKDLQGRGYAYKLHNSDLMYGMDAAGTLDPEPNESEMSMWVPYADGMRRDGVGDLLEVGGIVTERHQKNAIVLFDHGKHVVLPLGMAWARDTSGEYDSTQYFNEIDPVNQKARLKCYVWQGAQPFASGADKDHAVFCEQIFHMVCKKMLGCGSIGYQIIDGQEIPPDYQRGTPKGVHLRKVMMLEGSLVVLPANMDTAPKHKGFEWVREVLAMPKMCGKPLSPMFVKSFSDYCPEQTKTVVGFADVVETKAGIPKAPGSGPPRKPKVEPMAKPDFWTDEQYEEYLRAFFGGANAGRHDSDSYRDAMREYIARGNARQRASQRKRGAKSTEVPIPHGDLNDSKIPPAKWKPGAGAIKRVPEPTNINVFQPGETVTARKILTFTDKATGRVDTFARTGDRLEVVNVTGDGALATVRRPDGKQIQVTGASIRRSKGMETKASPGTLEDAEERFPECDRAMGQAGSLQELQKIKKEWDRKGVPPGPLELLYKKHKTRVPSYTGSQTSAADARIDRISTIRDSSGRGRGRKDMPDESKSLDEIRKRYKQLRLARARKHAPKSFKFLVTCKHEGKSGQFEIVASSMKDAAEIAKKCSKDKCGMPPSSIKAVKQAGQIKIKGLGVGAKAVSIDQVRRDLQVPGAHITQEPSSQYGGQSSISVRKNGVFFYSISPEIFHQLEMEGTIDFSGKPKKKSLEIKGKAMEDEEVDLETSPDETPDQDDWSGEPFGSQVLRRLHQDKSHLMKEYDGFMGLLDHEPTKGHLGSHMEYLEKFLGDTEKLHGKHYKHLSPIGGKTKDLTEEEAEDIGDELEEQTEDTEDDPVETEGEETAEEEVGGASENETVESDSSESDAPTPDEALEGMDKKDKKGKSLKVAKKGIVYEVHEMNNLVAVYRSPSDAERDAKQRGPKASVVPANEAPWHRDYMKRLKKSMCPECGKEGCSCQKGMETQGGNKWGLQDHEMKSAGEANDFMGELSSTQDFSDEHRMKSYHYHKTLDGIGQMGQVNEDLNQDPAIKSDPGSDQWQQEEMEEPEHQGNEFQKMCKDMSGWYKQLSQTRDFGDPHRKRCGMLHKAMSDMMGGAETEEVTEDNLGGTLEEDIPGDLGGMDEKALLNYEKAAIERSKQIAALAKQVAAIRL